MPETGKRWSRRKLLGVVATMAALAGVAVVLWRADTSHEPDLSFPIGPSATNDASVPLTPMRAWRRSREPSRM